MNLPGRRRRKHKRKPKEINPHLWIEGVDYKVVIDGYELLVEKSFNCGVKGYEFDEPFLSLDKKGKITLKLSFWWDGDTGVEDVILEASAFHDAGYWLILAEIIPETWGCRRKIDKMYFKLNRRGGMSWLRASGRYYGVRGIGWAFS